MLYLHFRRLYTASYSMRGKEVKAFSTHLFITARKRIFLHLSVILFTGGGSASVHAGIPPQPPPPGPCTHPPLDHAPTHPSTMHPPPQNAPTPPDHTPTPPTMQPPPRHRACWEIRSTRGRYASYWNAILFGLCMSIFQCHVFDYN